MSPEPHVTELPGTNPHNNSTASIDMSTKMMHEVFASLSLTDKCALSLTLDNTTSAIHNTPRSFNIDNAESSLLLDRIDPEVHTTYSNSIYEGYDNDEDMSEIHSVFSASDKESLVKAMSMMADQELQQVEDEVKKIQHNVRGWILRKNYNNLREAARVLQLAWREKKRSNTSHVDMINNISNNFAMMHDNVSDGIRSASSTVPNSRKSSFVDTLPNILDEFDINHPVNTYATKEERAAAKLQAATRRMIAKKSISSITKQTVASLVIQKHLVRWWLHAKYVQEDSNTSAATASSSASEEVPVRRPTTSSSSFSFSSSSSSIGMMASPPNK